ncbi:MAG: hypothetical protein J6Y07_04030 [Alphaproteobacteria bacterium]|nr:hypothetical protein [Alphaproteobacteria bacterium]
MRNNEWIKIIVVAVLITIGVFIFFKLNKTDTEKKPVDTEETLFTNTTVDEFNDGLSNPVSVHNFEPNEFGEGVVEVAVFSYDINEDGYPDKISRARRENGTAHFQYVYKVELNDGKKMVNITPKGLFTVEGLECARQKIQFSFKPDFSITKISRPLGEDWNTPTQSTKTVYTLWNKKLHVATTSEYKTVCDVSELF